MTSEPVVGVVLGRQVVGKMTLIYICLPFPSPTPQSQLTGTSSYYRFRCHHPLITYLTLYYWHRICSWFTIQFLNWFLIFWSLWGRWKFKTSSRDFKLLFGARNNLCLNAAASSLLNGASVMKKYEKSRASQCCSTTL